MHQVGPATNSVPVKRAVKDTETAAAGDGEENPLERSRPDQPTSRLRSRRPDGAVQRRASPSTPPAHRWSHELATLEGCDIFSHEFEPFAVLPPIAESAVPIALYPNRIISLD